MSRTFILKCDNFLKGENKPMADLYVDVVTEIRIHAFEVLNIYLLRCAEPVAAGAVPDAHHPRPNELITQKTVGHAFALVRGTNGVGTSNILRRAFDDYKGQPNMIKLV